MLAAIRSETTAPIVTTSGRSPSVERLELLAGALVADLRLADAARPRPRRRDPRPSSPPARPRAGSSATVPPPASSAGPGGAALLALAPLGPLAVAAAHSRRLGPRPAERASQLGGRRLGIGGVADRPDDDDAARPGRDDLGDVPGVDAADREPGQLGLGCRRAHVVEAGGGPPRLRRRRPDRPDAEVVGAGIPARSHERPRELLRVVGGEADDRRRVRRARRASATGTSSWPTWTPSAPARGDEVGAVVDQEERAVAIGRARGRRGAAASRRSSAASLSRSWIRSTPPRSAASSSRSRAAGSSRCLADEVEAGSARACGGARRRHCPGRGAQR